MKLSVKSEAIRRQCIEERRRGFSRARCTNEAVYGYYCEEHGTPPLSIRGKRQGLRLTGAATAEKIPGITKPEAADGKAVRWDTSRGGS